MSKYAVSLGVLVFVAIAGFILAWRFDTARYERFMARKAECHNLGGDLIGGFCIEKKTVLKDYHARP